jgi:hypothetical protein
MKKVFLLLIVIIFISVYSQISAEFTQLNDACYSVNKGVMKAKIIGETEPYIKAPKLNIYVTPGDTLYIKNPTGQFFFENPESETNPVLEWLWDFGDNNTTKVKSPIHTYSLVNEYLVTLKIRYAKNCDTTFLHPVKVKNVKLFIPNVITPNDDQHNDYFVITDMREKNSSQASGGYSKINDFYISNELIIYNRWGKTVFEAKNYLNDWDGGNLKDGVYFYVLKCVGKFEMEVYKGTITIFGSNN